jgi:hypothetical protein
VKSTFNLRARFDGVFRDFPSGHRAGHNHVGEHQIDVASAIEYAHGFVAVGGFDHRVAALTQARDRELTDLHVIFDHKR